VELKTRLSNSAIRIAIKLVAILPLRLARSFGVVCAALINLTKAKVYRITKINLQMTQTQLSSKELEKLCKKSVESTLVNSFEMPIIWHQTDQWVADKIERVDNLEIFNDCLAKQKGVILLSPHFGNWEIFGRHLSLLAPTTFLYQPPKFDAFEDFVVSARGKSGGKLAATNQRGIGKLLKALRNGEVTGILPDQVPKPPSGCYADFFSVPAYTMTLIHGLIQKTGCQVVLGFGLRTRTGFRLAFESVPDDLYSEDLQTSVDALNRSVEKVILNDVSQYQWAYKRFKLQPHSPNPYRQLKNRS
jgi:KDO2-lipid IV(A) lauroyltransferase